MGRLTIDSPVQSAKPKHGAARFYRVDKTYPKYDVIKKVSPLLLHIGLRKYRCAGYNKDSATLESKTCEGSRQIKRGYNKCPDRAAFVAR